MFKKILFQIHWFIGITVGTLLMLVGVTGAMLSFREEIIEALNPGILKVARQTASSAPMSLQQLVIQIQDTRPEPAVASVTLTANPPDASLVNTIRVNFVPPPGQKRGELRYADPYNAQLLPPLRAEPFLKWIEMLHRFLLLDPNGGGKLIMGSASMCLLLLALSGLYLRWPRHALRWRAWLRLDFSLQGRPFLWHIHSILGTWALVMYVVLTVTGMYWSFDWVKHGINGLLSNAPAARIVKAMGTEAARPALQTEQLARVWTAFTSAVPAYDAVTLRLPDRASQPVQVTYLALNAPHELARNRLRIDVETGAISQHERYADKDMGGRLIDSIYPLHIGSYFGLPGRILWMIAALALPLFGITGWMLYLDRRRKKKAITRQRAGLGATSGTAGGTDEAALNPPPHDPVLVVFASQSGYAEQIALRTTLALQAAGVTARVLSIAQLDIEHLRHHHKVLFVASTFGEGDAPDSARAFTRQLIHQGGATLAHVQYGILALGDRHYRNFCGYGQTLDHFLQSQGARSQFAMIEVDNSDPQALVLWQRALADFCGVAVTALVKAEVEAATPAYRQWSLTRRTHLNPGSAGDPIFHLELTTPPSADGACVACDWISGALVDIMPSHAHAPRRYSVASIAQDGSVHLLVRQAVYEGGLGLASGWLTKYAPLGSSVAMRLLENPSFALARPAAPAIFIGNGSGMAGLRSHLRARVRDGQRRNWLLFGERNRSCDFYYGDEIAQWQQDGLLERLDLAFSRDQAERIYVQDKLREAHGAVRTWLADGAVMYVCGSMDGMAAGVDAVLTEMIGEDGVEQLIAAGRYRRDIY